VLKQEMGGAVVYEREKEGGFSNPPEKSGGTGMSACPLRPSREHCFLNPYAPCDRHSITYPLAARSGVLFRDLATGGFQLFPAKTQAWNTNEKCGFGCTRDLGRKG